ncbi:MAG: hypothetical protein HF978_20385 [Desulfobacteraceae bacterium]|nr:hypothetical protein [Desulfobacteraceae bacterium]MBC2757907.1 hypothetical protein [Desulfobacteraceae bacterium]
MKKFLIIVKISSVQDFCRFYEQFLTGRVFLPSTNALPDHSKTILKLIVPLLEDPFLINGNVVSCIDDTESGFGMTIDIKDGLKTVLPEIIRKLSVYEQYQDIFSDQPAAETAAMKEIPEEITGLEMEIDEDEIQILEDNHPIEKKTSLSQDDSVILAGDRDDNLMNLKMENESDDSLAKVDLAHLPDFVFQDNDAAESKQEEDARETVSEDSSSEPEPEAPQEFALLPDDESLSEGFTMDFDTADPAFTLPENQGVSGVLFEDLKKMVEQGEFEFELEKEPDVTGEKIPEKKDLTPEEREKAEPVGQFFMNLTKAMLRSGYYAPGHPGADSAKSGLYDEFISVLGDQREIMITNHNSRDGIDLMLTGILDEPINIRVLVGPGVAELFVPKLSEYCERKKLLSFALKKDIKPGHFFQFIDIMSDPKVDDHKGKEAGKYLTDAFIEHGITEISTVFVDDMVELESELPWRVEMAIHRLAKDLKVVPMFKGVSDEAIKQMKLQTVQDIIRPLKHPTYLNDFLVNCYLIAKYVKRMASEDIEEIVVEAFSIHLLLPTSWFTFKELDHLKQLKKERPDNILIDRRLSGIKRILKLISRRVVVEKESGAQTFLEHLYQNEILSFNELPADVQYVINSMKLADDIRENFSKYSNAIGNIKDPDEALIYLKCFRRTAPVLIDSGSWEMLKRITLLIKSVSSQKPINTDKVHSGLKIIKSNEIEDFSDSKLFKSLDVSERPLGFIFKDVTDKIINSYEHADSKQRNLIDKIINELGSFGVDITSKMLIDSNDREVRKLSYEMMISKGDQARKWAIKVLDETSRPWYIHRNAMMILGKVSDKEEDFDCVRKFLEHSNPKMREEVINVAVSLKPHDGESLILKSIDDDDPKVRWLALRTIQHFSPISESAMMELLNIISLPIPKNNEAAENQINKTVNIISAINAMTYIPISRKVEFEILEALKSISGGKQSLWNKVKRAVGSDHETPVLKAAIPLLGKIGGSQSKTFLKKIIRLHPDFSEIIKKALLQIKS